MIVVEMQKILRAITEMHWGLCANLNLAYIPDILPPTEATAKAIAHRTFRVWPATDQGVWAGLLSDCYSL